MGLRPTYASIYIHIYVFMYTYMYIAIDRLSVHLDRRCQGNPKPRCFRLVEDEAVVNRMGLNNEGAEAVAKRLASFETLGRCPHCVCQPLGRGPQITFYIYIFSRIYIYTYTGQTKSRSFEQVDGGLPGESNAIRQLRMAPECRLPVVVDPTLCLICLV